MSYRLTDHGWLAGLGELPAGQDVDLTALTGHILQKILDASINIEITELSLGMLVPDVAERVLVQVASTYIGNQIKSSLDLKDKAKASNVATSLSNYLIDNLLRELAEMANIPDSQTIMSIDLSAAVASATIGTPYNQIAPIPLEQLPGYIGGQPLEIIGVQPMNVMRAAIFMLGNPSVAKITGVNIRSFLKKQIEDAIQDFAEWTGYEPAAGESMFGKGETAGGRQYQQAFTYETRPTPEFGIAEQTTQQTVPEVAWQTAPSSELPLVPIAIGIAAWILLT